MGVEPDERDEEMPASEGEETDHESRKLNDETDGIELKKVTVDRDIVNPPIVVIGDSKPYFKTTHLKYALLTFNCILGILGLIILILAVWIRVDPSFWEYENSLDISNFYTVCYLSIVVGLILVFFSFIGCFGVLIESKYLLITYFVIFVAIFVIELSAVIVVFSAPYSKTIRSSLEKQIKKQIDQMDTDDSSRKFIDFMQYHLECCGAESQNDYGNDYLPKSCSSSQTGNVFLNGCTGEVLQYLKVKAGMIGGVTVPILLIQLLAKFVCYFLIQNIRKESKYTMRD